MVAGANPPYDGKQHGRYVLARYSADRDLDTGFNAGGPSPGHVIAQARSDEHSGALGVAVDAGGTAT